MTRWNSEIGGGQASAATAGEETNCRDRLDVGLGGLGDGVERRCKTKEQTTHVAKRRRGNRVVQKVRTVGLHAH